MACTFIITSATGRFLWHRPLQAQRLSVNTPAQRREISLILTKAAQENQENDVKAPPTDTAHFWSQALTDRLAHPNAVHGQQPLTAPSPEDLWTPKNAKTAGEPKQTKPAPLNIPLLGDHRTALRMGKARNFLSPERDGAFPAGASTGHSYNSYTLPSLTTSSKLFHADFPRIYSAFMLNNTDVQMQRHGIHPQTFGLFQSGFPFTSFGVSTGLKHQTFTQTAPTPKPLSLQQQIDEAVRKSFLPQEDIDELYSIMEKTNRVCKKNNILYSIFTGSLLGFMRNGGPLPWDDDLDIGVPASYEQAFLNAKEDFEKEGLVCSRRYIAPGVRGWPLITEKQGPSWQPLPHKNALTVMYKLSLPPALAKSMRTCHRIKDVAHVWLDVFIREENPQDSRWHYHSPSLKKAWSSHFFTIPPFKHIRNVQFGDLSGISCISEACAEDILSNSYGKNWRTQAVLYSHRHGRVGSFPIDADERLRGYAKRSKLT